MATELNVKAKHDNILYGSTSTANTSLLSTEHETNNHDVIIDMETEEKLPKNTFKLELPKDILTAYILIHASGTWSHLSVCGKLGILFAVSIPLAIQILATFSLTAQIEWNQIRLDTDAEDLTYSIAALAALFIYMFNDIWSLKRTTWYFLGRLEQETDGLSSNGRQYFEQTSTQRIVKNINFVQFRVLIIAIFIMYIVLTFYAIVQINQMNELVAKLDVALSIFIILQIDTWAYGLFIRQNRILSEDHFEIEMTRLNPKKHSLKDSERSLWFTIFVVLFAVLSLVTASIISNVYNQMLALL